MSLAQAKLGSTFIADQSFKNADGTPFSPQSPAAYTVRDFNNTLIVSGLAAQDGQYPEIWHATITLPESAPYSNSQKYTIYWMLVGGPGGTSIAQAQDTFFVYPADNTVVPSDADQFENELVITQGDEVTDAIFLPSTLQLSSYRIRILDEINTVYYDQQVSNAQSVDVQGQNMYGAILGEIDSLTLNTRPYIVEWSYQLNGRTKKEYHFLYVVDFRTINHMNRLRNFIDKIRFDHPNPNLRYNDVDLVSYLQQGIQILNYSAPTYTSWRLNNLPQEFEWFLTNAAAYVALSSQYIAEGVQAFEFGGSSVNLTIDRQSSIDSALGRIIDVVKQDLPAAKKLASKQAVTGVMTISPSPSLNPQFMSLSMQRGFNQNYIPDYGSRLRAYAGLIGQIGIEDFDVTGF